MVSLLAEIVLCVIHDVNQCSISEEGLFELCCGDYHT